MLHHMGQMGQRGGGGGGGGKKKKKKLTLILTLDLLLPSIFFNNKIFVFIMIFTILSFLRLIF